MTQSFLGTRKILEAYKGTQRIYAYDEDQSIYNYLKDKISVWQEVFNVNYVAGMAHGFILRTDAWGTQSSVQNNAPRVWTGCTASNMSGYSDFEIGTRFYVESEGYQCLFASNNSSNYGATPSIEIRTSGFGVGLNSTSGSAAGWTVWKEVESGNNLNKWVFVKLHFDSSTKTVTLSWSYDNCNTYSSWTYQTNYDLQWSQEIMFGGFQTGFRLSFLGKRDMKKTYVKRNGILMYGCDLDDIYYMTHPNE